MKLNKSELLERINNLNQSKPLLKEDKEIQRVASPADADALEQHEEALKQNKERKDPKNFDENVKELIKDTASEESRYRHFDVVDRKDLAKRINEAKQKGLDFKVTRGNKEGFRYDLAVLKEEFLKKDAGNPEVNVQAFNNATNVGASSPMTGLGEDMEEEPIEQCSICDSIKFLIDDEKEAIDGYKKADECLESLDDEELKVKISSLYNHIIGEELEHIRELQEMLAEVDPNCSKELSIELHEQLTDDVYNYEDDGSPRPRVSGEQLAYDLVSWISDHEGDVLDDVIEYLDRLGYEERVINGLFFRGDALIENMEKSGDDLDEENDSDELHEELKVYTSTLDGFHPSLKAEKFWNEIKEKGKVKDLEEALELLFPEGIKDEALDVFLRDEEDWVRDLIDLPLEDEETEEYIETKYKNKEDSDNNISEKDKDIIIDAVKGEFETGHGYIEDKDEFEEMLGRTLTIDEYEDLKEFYSELQDLGPVGFYEEYKDKLEFDTDFVREYGYNEDDESEDDIEPIEYDEEDEESEEEIENENVEEEVKEEPKKELKECQEHSDEKEKEEDISDDKVEALANGYINNNFKENNADNMTSEKDLNKEIKESQENTDDEFVEISDDEVNDMMGLPKKEKEGNH